MCVFLTVLWSKSKNIICGGWLLYLSLSPSFSPTHKRSLDAGEKGSEVAGGCYCAVSEGLTVDPLMIDHHGYRGT